MPESYDYVYIDAPSLDNADQSKFLLFKDSQYVQIGDSSKGNIAQFPLYEKFLSNNEINKMVDLDGLSRVTFKSGKVANNSENLSVGGDYLIGNTCLVSAKNFKVGRLTALKFRIYKKEKPLF